MNILERIQQLQFEDKHAAEALLMQFLNDTLQLNAAHVELRPLAVSLNSFNGFVTQEDGKRLFFKTHTESDGIIAEYYNAEQLAEAGYPVLKPVYSSTEAGKQLLVYEVITDPSVFDLAWGIEQGDNSVVEALTQAQHRADEQLLSIYLNTLGRITSEQNASAPVHQLFYHRLAYGRLPRFYGSASSDVFVTLDRVSEPCSMQEVMHVKWTINDQYYGTSLSEIIRSALRLLNPNVGCAAIIGHGDAHNGNIFFRHESQSLLYFDPAFAGRHDPLLDLVKPLFHNVFALWMYYPQEKAQDLRISLRRDDDTWIVEHNYKLPMVRDMFLTSKVERVLAPILIELKKRGWLRSDWRQFLKAALFCCPFLTMNLADSTRFPPEISLLGLVMSVEMGAESAGERSKIDRLLDDLDKLTS